MKCPACEVDFDPIAKPFIRIVEYRNDTSAAADERVCSWDCAAAVVEREQKAADRKAEGPNE